jgi:hypothetical protein
MSTSLLEKLDKRKKQRERIKLTLEKIEEAKFPLLLAVKTASEELLILQEILDELTKLQKELVE